MHKFENKLDWGEDVTLNDKQVESLKTYFEASVQDVLCGSLVPEYFSSVKTCRSEEGENGIRSVFETTWTDVETSG